MISTATILVCVLAAAVAGLPGYYISFCFNRSNYAANDRSGDFGTPRGGFFATFGGTLIGMVAVSLASHLPSFPQEAAGPALIVAMFVGGIAGFIGMTRGQKSRKAS